MNANLLLKRVRLFAIGEPYVKVKFLITVPIIILRMTVGIRIRAKCLIQISGEQGGRTF